MKINTTLLTIILFFLHIYTYAQDVIVKNDKSEINVKVEEVTADAIKYRYSSRLDGPIYNISKSDVFLIIYKDGSRETFTPIPSPSFGSSSSPTLASQGASAKLSDQPKESPANQQPTAKKGGWSWGFGYQTPSAAFASLNGYTTESGYYWLLGARQTAGLSIDAQYGGYFESNSPTYASLMVNSFIRFSPTSKVYTGAGIGYASIGVPYLDRYGLTKKTYLDGLGSKIFMGVGSFRATLFWPSLDTGSNSLFSIGFYSNPFN